MFATMKIQPQVADTDLFGAVDYIAATRWFDRARTPIYNELFPGFSSRDPAARTLIVGRMAATAKNNRLCFIILFQHRSALDAHKLKGRDKL